MKPSLILSVLGLAAIVACQAPTIPSAPPSISFVGFRNTVSNVVIPSTSSFVPANFTAELTSSDRNKVTNVQCAGVTNPVGYRTTCSYTGQSGVVNLQATATNSANLSSTTTKSVTVDSTPPVATGLQVGGTSFDPTTGNAFSTTITLGATALLRVTSAGSDILGTFIEQNGKQVVSSPNNSAQFEINPQDSTPFSVGFGVIDTAGNVARYTVLVSVNEITGDGTAPTVNIASPVAGATVSGNLIVTVNASDTGGVDKVTLIANNNPVTTTSPPNGSPSVSFPLDTLQFENGVLELKAIAVDKSGLSTTSNAVLTTVNNIQGPVLSIAAPNNNASVSGPTSVSVNMRRRASTFNFASAAQCTAATLPTNCGSVKVDLIDYRGTIVESKFVTTANPGETKLFETSTFDLSAIPNDFYTIKASVSVVVGANTTTDTLTEQIIIRNNNANESPPAAIIIAPLRINEQQSVLPAFRQASGYLAADISDNLGITFAELRMTCDSCTVGNGPVNALEQYQAFTPPVTSARIVLSFNASGTPFLPDGDYTMRLVIEDTSKNRNIQEIKVRLNRDPATANPFIPSITDRVDNFGDKLTPGAATFNNLGFNGVDNYTGLHILTGPTGSPFSINTTFASVNPPNITNAIRYSFNASGVWALTSQFQNMTNGDIYSTGITQSVAKIP